jgi:hypothetical protein
MVEYTDENGMKDSVVQSIHYLTALWLDENPKIKQYFIANGLWNEGN